MSRKSTKRLLRVSPLPFVMGQAQPHEHVYILTNTEHGKNLLEFSKRNGGEPQQVFSLATAALDDLRQNAPSVTKALQLMELLSSKYGGTTGNISERHRFLNVALGGQPNGFTKDYGRFVPCKVHLKDNSFPNNSFLGTPCSCKSKKENRN